jgi:uncharacterized membrane protein YkvA (DUF1232 family)
MEKIFSIWREKARELKRQTYTVYLACKDPRTPWYAKALSLVVVGYACSPVDFIPDFIPILGYLDDLILIPLGIKLVIRLVPEEVMAESREKATATLQNGEPKNWIAGAIIISIWVLVLIWIIRLILRFIKGR